MSAKKTPLEIAILGFGGRTETLVNCARQFPNQIRFTCVADLRPDRRQRAAEMLGDGCRLFESAEDFYSQNIEVDGIWVISQECTHAQLAVPALERGIPLILEKPLATSLRDAYRICEAFDRNPVPVTVPHSMRYLPSYRKVKAIVDSGALGRILHIHAVEQVDDWHTVGCYRRGMIYRSNSTYLLGKCSHDIDMINWMMGGVRAKSVASFGGADYFKPRPEVPKSCSDKCPEAATCPFFVVGRLCAWNSGSEQVDHHTLIIQYEDGTTADFTLNCFGNDQRPLQITGSHGTVYATPRSVRLVVYRPPGKPDYTWEEYDNGKLLAEAGAPDWKGDIWALGENELMEDWIDSVLAGRKTASATVHESAEAVAVCVAAEMSMLQHKLIDMADLRKQRPGPEVLLLPR